MRFGCRVLLLLVVAGLSGCGPATAPQAPEPSPAERHVAALLRPGGMFVQARIDRIRRWLPSLGEIATLVWTPSLPGASCMVDLLWSADVASAWLATPSRLASPTSGAALIDGAGIPDARVPAWADCVLAGLGSGTDRRAVAAPPAPDGRPDTPPPAPLSFVGGTGPSRNLGIASLAPGRFAIVAGEPFETWAWELAGWADPETPDPPECARRVADADVQLVWLDPEAIVDLLARGSAGLGSVPPSEELRGLAIGLWLGERPRTEAYVQARGPDAAAAVGDALRTFATVLQLSVSVQAAQLGMDYGADIQQRAEQVAAIAGRALFEVHESMAIVKLELTTADLELLQGFVLALASRAFRE